MSLNDTFSCEKTARLAIEKKKMKRMFFINGE
jgi:hypothetical protein